MQLNDVLREYPNAELRRTEKDEIELYFTHTLSVDELESPELEASLQKRETVSVGADAFFI